MSKQSEERGTIMPKPTLSHLLEQSRTMETDKRLMSEIEIHDLLNQADTGTAKPRLSPLPFIERLSTVTKTLTALSAAAAIGVAYFLLPNNPDQVKQSHEIAYNASADNNVENESSKKSAPALMKSFSTEQRTISAEPNTLRTYAYKEVSDDNMENGRENYKIQEQKATITPLMLDNLTSVLTLTSEQLKKLGIIVTKNTVTYIERDDIDLAAEARKRGLDPEIILERIGAQHITAIRKVTARTNGIGDVRSDDSSKAAIAPLMITSYVNRRAFASYYSVSDRVLHNTIRRIDEKSEIITEGANKLIPVLVSIENAQESVFKKADIILWFEPTDNFINALPDNYKSALKKELGMPEKPKTGEQRYTDTWREEDGALINTRVYPNPTQDFDVRFSFSLSENRTCSIGIMDMFGHTLSVAKENMPFEKGEHRIDINLQDIDKNGIYLIVMQTDAGEQIVQRLIVQR